MERKEHIWIPHKDRRRPAVRGDRWVASVLLIGAAFWLCVWLVLR